jgi:hypothetical protein
MRQASLVNEELLPISEASLWHISRGLTPQEQGEPALFMIRVFKIGIEIEI